MRVFEHALPDHLGQSLGPESLNRARADYLYTRWKKWADVIVDLQRLVDETPNTATPGEVRRTMNQFLSRSMLTLGLHGKRRPRRDPLEAENYDFGEKILRVVSWLNKVRADVCKYRADPNSLIDALAEEGLNFTLSEPAQFRAFCIVFPVTKSVMRKQFSDDCVGGYVYDTPFVLIDRSYHSKHPEQREECIKHELGHVMLNPLKGEIDTDPDETLLPTVKRAARSRHPSITLKQTVTTLNPLSTEREEFVVELAQTPAREIFKRDYILIPPNPASWYWTAGGDIGSLAEKIQRLTEGNLRGEDGEYLKEDFYNFSVRLSRALYAAKHIGQAAVKEVLALAVVVLPDHYNHLLGYLRYRFGEAPGLRRAYDLPIIGPTMLTLSDIRSIVELDDNFLEEDFALLNRMALKELDVWKKGERPLASYGIRNRDDLDEYMGYVKYLETKVATVGHLADILQARSRFHVHEGNKADHFRKRILFSTH